MKKILVLAIVAILMVSCSELIVEYESEESALLSEQETSQTSIVNFYLEKARWGDSDAFLNLAKCYHDGIGVKSDFMGTLTMLMMADLYGVPNHTIEDYLTSLPDTDHTKMLFEAIDKLDRQNILTTDSIVEILIANGSPDGYALRGVVQVERGDTLCGQQSLKKGAEMGSSFAELMLCAFPTEEAGYRIMNVEMLRNLSSRSPIANIMLGDIYSGYNYGDTTIIDESLAEIYYKKADKQGCLGKRPARWLINYYDRNGIKIDAKELERLQILSGHIDEPGEFIPDSVYVGPEYLEADSVATSE